MHHDWFRFTTQGQFRGRPEGEAVLSSLQNPENQLP